MADAWIEALERAAQGEQCEGCASVPSERIFKLGCGSLWLCEPCLHALPDALRRAQRPPVPELLRFREGEVCIKCGQDGASVTYIESGKRISVVSSCPPVDPGRDVLLLTCRRCQYYWTRFPLDLDPGMTAEPWPLVDRSKPVPTQRELDLNLQFGIPEFLDEVRLKNLFHSMGLETLGQLASLTEREFLAGKNAGNVALGVARRGLAGYNLRFRQTGEKVLRPK